MVPIHIMYNLKLPKDNKYTKIYEAMFYTILENSTFGAIQDYFVPFQGI